MLFAACFSRFAVRFSRLTFVFLPPFREGVRKVCQSVPKNMVLSLNNKNSTSFYFVLFSFIRTFDFAEGTFTQQ